MDNIPRSLFFWSIILLTVVLISLGTFYFDNSRNMIENQYLDSFDTSVHQLNTSITEFLITFENALQMFSQNDMVKSLPDNADQNLVQVEQMFRSFQESYPYSAYAYYVFKRPMADGRFMVTWPDTSSELKSGAYDPPSRPWYKGAVDAEGGIAWSDPYPDATTGKKMVTVSRIVESNANAFGGVMAIDVFLDELSNKVENFKSFSHGSAFIVKKQGDDFVFITKDNTNDRFNDILTSEWIQAIDDKPSDILEVSIESLPYYVAYTTNDITGWKILGVVEKKKIFEETMAVLKEVLFSTIVVLGIGLLSMAYISRQLTNSVKDIGHMIKLTPVKDQAQPSKLKTEFERISLEIDKDGDDDVRTTLNMVFDSETEMSKVADLLASVDGKDIEPGQGKQLTQHKQKLLELKNELLREPSARKKIQADEIDKIVRKIEMIQLNSKK